MSPRAWLVPAVVALMAVQGFHVFEHALQTYQKYGQHSDDAHGLLGRYFDRDALHFAFNAGLLAAAIAIARLGPLRTGLAWTLFQVGVAAQAYHAVEHGAKLWQSAVLGLDPSPGLLGNWIPLIPLHLALNALCYALLLPHLLALAIRPRDDLGPPAARPHPEA